LALDTIEEESSQGFPKGFVVSFTRLPGTVIDFTLLLAYQQTRAFGVTFASTILAPAR